MSITKNCEKKEELFPDNKINPFIKIIEIFSLFLFDLVPYIFFLSNAITLYNKKNNTLTF
jgi:hypothetical protein